MNSIYRPTKAIIDLDKVYSNYLEVKNRILNKSIIPVVKANAYGHGSVEIVKHLHKHGVNFVAVSLLEEALELREQFKCLEILVMGMITVDELPVVSKYNIVFTVYDEAFASKVLHSKEKLRFHVKFDSGMNRLGIKDEKILDHFLLQALKNNNLTIEGLFTHFATSDSNKDFHKKQLVRFENMLKNLSYKPKMIHVSNSSSTIKFENGIDFTTHARVGILLYGLTLDKGLDFLKPAMEVKTQVLHIKTLNPGECVSYDITYCADQVERVAVLPIGYADGLIRKNQGGCVEINSKTYPIVGRICMDQTIVKIDDNVRLGDEVTILGGSIITTDNVADRLNTINYEIVTQVGARIPRIYISKEV